MEEKIINNLLFGYPFTFPFWKKALDETITLQQACDANNFEALSGFSNLNKMECQRVVENTKRLFAVYASGDQTHKNWDVAKHAVRAFPNSYREAMGLKESDKSWMPRLI